LASNILDRRVCGILIYGPSLIGSGTPIGDTRLENINVYPVGTDYVDRNNVLLYVKRSYINGVTIWSEIGCLLDSSIITLDNEIAKLKHVSDSPLVDLINLYTGINRNLLKELGDVNIYSVQNTQVLSYSSIEDKWINITIPIIPTWTGLGDRFLRTDGTNIYWSSVPGGIDHLSGLVDVTITSAIDNDVLSYDSSLGMWINMAFNAGAFSGLTDVQWTQLADNDIPLFDTGTFKWINVPIPISFPGFGTSHSTASYGDHNHTVDNLSNVTVTNKSDSDILKWDTNAGKWINVPIPTGTTALAGLTTDVNLGQLSNGDVLSYDSNSSMWINVAFSAGTFSGLSDVTFSHLTPGDIPIYDGNTNMWINIPSSSFVINQSASVDYYIDPDNGDDADTGGINDPFEHVYTALNLVRKSMNNTLVRIYLLKSLNYTEQVLIAGYYGGEIQFLTYSYNGGGDALFTYSLCVFRIFNCTAKISFDSNICAKVTASGGNYLHCFLIENCTDVFLFNNKVSSAVSLSIGVYASNSIIHVEGLIDYDTDIIETGIMTSESILYDEQDLNTAGVTPLVTLGIRVFDFDQYRDLQINALLDVNESNLADNDILKWDANSSMWVNISSGKLYANVNYYVDQDNGDDNNVGTFVLPFQHINYADSLIPKDHNGFTATIWLKDCSNYSENIVIKDHHNGFYNIRAVNNTKVVLTEAAGCTGTLINNINNDCALRYIGLSVRIINNSRNAFCFNHSKGSVITTSLGDTANTGTVGVALVNKSEVSVDTITNIDASKVAIGFSIDDSIMHDLGNCSIGDVIDSITNGGILFGAINIKSSAQAWNALVTFPGFGTSHSTVAYGDHNHNLDALANVTITSVQDTQIVSWDANSSKWVNVTKPTTFPGFAGSGSASSASHSDHDHSGTYQPVGSYVLSSGGIFTGMITQIIGQYFYMATSATADTIKDVRMSGDVSTGNFVFEYCSTANVTKGAGVWTTLGNLSDNNFTTALKNTYDGQTAETATTIATLINAVADKTTLIAGDKLTVIDSTNGTLKTQLYSEHKAQLDLLYVPAATVSFPIVDNFIGRKISIIDNNGNFLYDSTCMSVNLDGTGNWADVFASKKVTQAEYDLIVLNPPPNFNYTEYLII